MLGRRRRVARGRRVARHTVRLTSAVRLPRDGLLAVRVRVRRLPVRLTRGGLANGGLAVPRLPRGGGTVGRLPRGGGTVGRLPRRGLSVRLARGGLPISGLAVPRLAGGGLPVRLLRLRVGILRRWLLAVRVLVGIAGLHG
ncbi:hypothetical protein ACWDV4_26440 [Micromonospora sp. NPDC003197]